MLRSQTSPIAGPHRVIHASPAIIVVRLLPSFHVEQSSLLETSSFLRNLHPIYQIEALQRSQAQAAISALRLAIASISQFFKLAIVLGVR